MLVIFFILGLFLGSFANVLVLRTHSDESPYKGRSHCPKCKRTLKWYELVPVLSYVFLRGQCHKCHKPISAQYPIAELIFGLLFAGLWWHFKPVSAYDWVILVLWALLSIYLLSAAVYDARWSQLPDHFMLPAIIGAAAILTVEVVQSGDWTLLFSRLLAVLLFAGGIYLMWLVSRGKWIGDGDIRIAIVAALLLSTQQLLVGLLFAFNSAAVVAIILIILKRKKRTDTLPIGSYLIAGIYFGLFFGSYLWGLLQQYLVY